MIHKNIIKQKKYGKRIILIWAVALSAFFTACDTNQPSTIFTVGIINYVSVLEPIIDGFKTGMKELGYIEGETIIYIYNGVVEANPQAIDSEIEKLLAGKIDLLFSLGSLTTVRAKKAVVGMDIPVVFGAVPSPVEQGIVESISHPGGKLTGIQVGTQFRKALEWLIRITPEARKVYLPYNPEDEVSVTVLAGLDDVSSQLGVELISGEVYSVEEAVAAIRGLPEDIDAIFRIPSPTLDSRNSELSLAAIERRLPMGADLPLDEAVLLTLATDYFETGKQSARLAHQIRQGAKPANLPVEITEFFLTINLRTAESIGLEIPNEILMHADSIIHS